KPPTMSSMMNAFRSVPSAARPFTSVNISHISTASSAKTAFHPEHHSIVLQQLTESIVPKTTSATAQSLSSRAAIAASKQAKH
ncbi:hypothetical protein BGZ46_001187, partial [Entomortierella lignicola]